MKGPPPPGFDLTLNRRVFPQLFPDQAVFGPPIPDPFLDPFVGTTLGPWSQPALSDTGPIIQRIRNPETLRGSALSRQHASSKPRQPLPPAYGMPPLPIYPYLEGLIVDEPEVVFPRAFQPQGVPNVFKLGDLVTMSDGESMDSAAVDHWLSMKAHTPPPDHDDLAILKDKNMKPASKTHAMTTLEAIRLAVMAKDKAIELKDDDFKYSVQAKSIQEFPHAIFNEIDALCFAGVLRGNVHLKWGTKMPPGVFGRTKRPPQNGGRIEIYLSDSLCDNGNPEDILGVLLHQMTHAFLLQCCEPKAEKDPGYKHPLSHDPTLSAVACAVQQAVKMDPGSYPSLMGCNAVPDEPKLTALDTGKIKAFKHSRCSAEDYGKPYDECSMVLTQIKQRADAPKLKLDKGCATDDSGRLLPTSQWLHDKPGSNKPILKVEYEKDTPDYITLLYKNRAYPVPKKKCPETAPPKLDMDSDLTDEKTFRLVYEYLTSGKWSPSPPTYSSGIKYPQPPGIAPLMPSELPYFLTQLRVYRAAMQLGLPKMREIALESLEKSARSKCVEDPIVLLEMLYHGTTTLGASEASDSASSSGKKDKDKSASKSDSKSTSPPAGLAPDRDLRTWARGFFKAPTEDKKMPANIDVLKRGEQYKLRWNQLRMKGKFLLEDADQCEAELDEEREKKAKKKETEAEADKNDATYKAMTAALQGIVPGGSHNHMCQAMGPHGAVIPQHHMFPGMPPQMQPLFPAIAAPAPYQIVPAADMRQLMLEQGHRLHDEARSEAEREREHLKNLEAQYRQMQLQDEREKLEKERLDLEEAKKNFRAGMSCCPPRFMQPPDGGSPFAFFPPVWSGGD